MESPKPREKPIDPFMASPPSLKRKKQQVGRETSKKQLPSQTGCTTHSYSRDELPITQGMFLALVLAQT